MTPCVSVVLCTYNRAAVLGEALNALARQTAAPASYEVIVVDNNSTDETAVVAARCAREAPNIRYVREPRQGLPIARNTGVGHARAGIVAFTDDDVEVAPDWVEEITRGFDSFPTVGCLGGRVLPVWEGIERPAWVPATHYGPLALQDRGSVPFTVGSHDVRVCLIGANFAVRRDVFNQVGLFSPQFPWGEDREFQLRAWQAGVRGLYFPDAVATCRVPRARLTKRYQRQWHAKAGRVHARMQLLERMDAGGVLVEPVRGRRVLGAPGYLVRSASRELLGWAGALTRLRRARAFQHETRLRYLAAYIAECRRRGSRLTAESHRSDSAPSWSGPSGS
jgi:GT2 family glycosyltransferase